MRHYWPLVLLLAACSDPAAPDDPAAALCAPVFACRSPGVNVQVVSFELAATRFDAATGLAIIHPDSVPVSFMLRNVGSDTAPASNVYLTVEGIQSLHAQTVVPYPALAPGEEFRYSSTLGFVPHTPDNLRDDRVELSLHADAEHDADFSDNHVKSAGFHLAAPLLQYTYTLSSENVMAGEAVTLNVVARNYGRHAAAPARTMTACLYAEFTGCTTPYRTTAGTFTAPPVPAGGVVEFQTTLPIPATAAWQDAAALYTMVLCDATSSTPAYLGERPSCYSGSRVLHVRPDYEGVCAPPQLQPNVSLTLAGYNCGLRPAPAGQETAARQYRFHIVTFDAAADVTYQVQRSDTSTALRLYKSDGVAVLDRDPATDRFRMPFAQRLYLVHYTAQDSFTITVTPAAEDA